MNSDLDALERKIADVVSVIQHIRAENLQLRQQVAALEDEKGRLGDRLTAARTRMEALLARMPEEAAE